MPETTQETLSRLTNFISESYTDVDTGPGTVVSELLLKLAATLHNNQYNLISDLRQGNIINQVLSSSEDTYSPVVDELASNYNIERYAGFKSVGKIKITVSSPLEYYIREGTLFLQPALDLYYSVKNDYRISLDPALELGELPLIENNGMYYFVIDVEALEVGEKYQVPAGAVFSLESGSFINKFVKAEAYGNFSAGKSLETDKQLITRFKAGLSHSKLESYTGITNKFSSLFPSFQTLNICGANDEEMVRDKQNALGISTFGKADVYVRSSLGVLTIESVKTAKKIAPDVWRMEIKNSDFPGFYNVKSILPNTNNLESLAGSLYILSTHFGVSHYPFQRNNELHSNEEARFTKYQTATVTFNYTETPSVAISTERDFLIQVNMLPDIDKMQNLLLLDQQRLVCADFLVKAVSPCFVNLNISIVKRRVTDTYDSLNLKQLKQDIFTYINTIPFGEELHASNIIDLCHNYNIRRVDLPLKMEGIILCPDGTTLTLNDSDVLSIPKNLKKKITKNNTLYFIDYYNVDAGSANVIDNIGINIA